MTNDNKLSPNKQIVYEDIRGMHHYVALPLLQIKYFTAFTTRLSCSNLKKRANYCKGISHQYRQVNKCKRIRAFPKEQIAMCDLPNIINLITCLMWLVI